MCKQEACFVAPSSQHASEATTPSRAGRVVQQGKQRHKHMPSTQSHSTKSKATNTCTSAEVLCCISDFCCSSRLQPCQLTHILDCQAAATKEVGKILATTHSHADALRESADQLYYLNQELQSCCVPAFDVHTARQVLETGTGCSGHHLRDISPSAISTSCSIWCSESCMYNSFSQCRSTHSTVASPAACLPLTA